MNIPSRYMPLGQVFSGGMGDVHIYRDGSLDRDVAIKMVQNKSLTSRLLDEVRAFKHISSKHVVEIYDIIESENGIAIVEEYLQGEDLKHPDQGVNKDFFLRTAYQIASGLCVIHAAGLVHRDIKPFNMKYDGEGILKIFDFGLARLLGVDSSTKGFRGTYGYAAPELYQEGTVEFTQAIDVYAFGVTCLYYAIGKLPDEIKPIRNPKISITPFSILLQDLLPKELQELFDRTVSFFPASRPSMAELKQVIERYMLLNKHRALIILNKNSYVIDKKNTSVTVTAQGKGKIIIQYDGLYFKLKRIEGVIMINNMAVDDLMVMPGACVISFGKQEAARTHVSFDISHPGVVL